MSRIFTGIWRPFAKSISAINKFSKSCVTVIKLFLLFFQSTAKARSHKNYHFWNYSRILAGLLEYFKSSEFNARLRETYLTGKIKQLADLERYSGNQAGRDLHNSRLAKRLYEIQKRGQHESTTTRLMGGQFSSSFGHLACGVGERIRASQLGLTQSNYVMLGSRVANRWFVEEYLSSHVPFVYLQEDILRLVEVTSSHCFEDIEYLRIGNDYFGFEVGSSLIEEEWNKRFPEKSVFSLKPEDRNYGYSKLSYYGFENIDWFVTFHFRKSVSEKSRNVNPESYLEAIELILDAGGHVFCVGDGGELGLTNKTKNFYDFGAIQVRDDRLDIFLLAECEFMVGTSSGPIDVPPLFGRGVLWTNCSNLVMNRPHKNSIVIPRLRIRNQRPSFSELLADINLGLYEGDSLPNWSDGVELDSNTSAEISSGVLEMLRQEWTSPIVGKEKVLIDVIKERCNVSSNRISNFFLESNFS
jgi:putative glycosyltransferase (TIGR04372 family)